MQNAFLWSPRYHPALPVVICGCPPPDCLGEEVEKHPSRQQRAGDSAPQCGGKEDRGVRGEPWTRLTQVILPFVVHREAVGREYCP